MQQGRRHSTVWHCCLVLLLGTAAVKRQVLGERSSVPLRRDGHSTEVTGGSRHCILTPHRRTRTYFCHRHHRSHGLTRVPGSCSPQSHEQLTSDHLLSADRRIDPRASYSRQSDGKLTPGPLILHRPLCSGSPSQCYISLHSLVSERTTCWTGKVKRLSRTVTSDSSSRHGTAPRPATTRTAVPQPCLYNGART